MKSCFIFGLTAAWLAVCPAVRSQQQVIDSLRAVVNEVPITQQEIGRLIEQQEQLLYDTFGRTQPEVFRKRETALVADAGETLVDREIILHEFKDNVKIPESILDQFVQDQIKQDFGDDRVTLTKQLELQGMTFEQFKQKQRERFIVTIMREKNIPEPLISPLKVENYYSAHRNEFKIEDQIKLRMIVIKKNSSDSVEQARARAGEILSQIKGGASFEELARSYSEGSQRSEGGETGWEDVSIVNPVLLAEVNKLKPGQCSGVIDLADAFYLLLLEDRHPTHYKPLNEVRRQIEKSLASEETDRLARQWIARLKRKTYVKYF